MRIERGRGDLLARLRPGRNRRGHRDPAARAASAAVAGASEVPSDEPGMRRFERPEQLPPASARHSHVPLPRRLRHLPLRVRQPRRRRRCCSTPTARSRSRLEPSWSRRFARATACACAVRAPPLPGRVMSSARAMIPAVAVVLPLVVLRVVAATALAVRHDRDLAAAARHPARLGHRAALRASSAGARAAFLALGLSHWDWGADGLARAHARDRHPGDDGGGGRARPPRPTRLAGDRRAGRARHRAATAARDPAADRGAPPLPRARAARARAKGSGRSRRRAAAPTARSTPSACGCGACSRKRAASTSSSVRSPRRASTSCRPRCAPSSPGSRTGSRRSRSSRSSRCWRPSSATRVEQVFAEFDWEPLAAASIGQTYRARLRSGEAVVVKVQRPGVKEIIERDLAALALARRRRAAAHDARSGHSIGRGAGAVRAEPARRARLPARGRRDARDGHACSRERSTVRIPKVYEELCTRRLIVQERFEGFTVADTDQLDASTIDRSALADQLLRAMLEQVLRVGFFHADPHPGNVFVVRRRHARSHRLRRGRPARSDPAGRGRRHARRPDPARREPAPRRHRAGRRRHGGGVGRTARARARAPHGREHPADRHDRAHRAARPRAHAVGVRDPPPRRSRRAVARARHPRGNAARDLADGVDGRRREPRWCRRRARRSSTATR